ncbi:hypothetical protein LI951_12055 [Enterococcus sp. BWT-B8]|uniref:hypothetical protein n=1 Tax=Enterococcus sp. BWT-B8 TaxID=2885157 RepID=UPI001E2DB303|nr:hypothetical protein [Enterococcus sp. BWT-B8]MCB5952803.1 hypothetical protein [Enterococcus sp. BWT-B8]
MTKVGGWTIPETPEITEDVRKVLKEAVSGLDGSSIEPFALLGTQIVAGVNYKLVCKVTPIVPDAETKLSIVTIYKPLTEKAELKEITDI